jgi:hypothetical protein
MVVYEPFKAIVLCNFTLKTPEPAKFSDHIGLKKAIAIGYFYFKGRQPVNRVT